MSTNFDTVSTFGDHAVLKYNTNTHPFRKYFEDLYETQDIENLHLQSSVYQSDTLQDVETDLHKKFYKDIKLNDTFKRLYCTLIKDIYKQFYPEEDTIIYQSFPSVRFQFINNTTVPPHYDSDDIGRHPLGERNFLLPITAMLETTRLFIESTPGSAEFKGIDMEYGNLFMFNGNRCTHYNEKNTGKNIRISLDFRIIHRADYMKYIKSGEITTTNPRDPAKERIPTKMVIGGYYQVSKQSDTLEEMMKWHSQKELLLQSRPNFDIAEANACFEYMKDGVNFVTEYQQTTKLERMIAEFIGVKHVLMTTSGSMALALALLGCDIGPGDDVIVPDYTMIATINAVKMVGANPIIVDVDKRSFTLTKTMIEQARTPKTKCVLFVSLNNRQVDLADIQIYCEKEGLLLLEDAAQSLGARVNGKHFGTFGKVGCFSLSTPKIISTGQGGFVITDDDEVHRKMNMIKNFGRKSGGVDVFELYGLNIKFTDIQAVIGIEQMKKLPGRVNQLRSLYKTYYEGLKDLPIFMFPPTEDYLPWFIDIYVEKRDELAAFLKVHNIQTRPTYPELHRTPMYLSDREYPITSYIARTGLFLPSHTLVTIEDARHICKLITFFLISTTRMKVFIFANCQGGVIKDFFPKMFEVVQYHNLNFIFDNYLNSEFKTHLTTCDWFIYQPLSLVYPVYNTENLKRYLKPDCKTISFPYIFNDAFTPIYKTPKHDIAINGEYSTIDTYKMVYKNIEPIVSLKREKNLPLEQILDLYDNNKIDFRYQERFDNTIKILQEKEKLTDVKVSQFILDNYKKYKLFNYHTLTTDDTHCNHPSNYLLLYYMNQIFRIMGLEEQKYDGPEIMRGKMLVSRYDIAFYKYEWVDNESKDIDMRIRDIITTIYEKY